MNKRDFLSLYDFSSAELAELIRRAIELKAQCKAGQLNNTLAGRSLAMLFEKSSTRTRVSFEVGMSQLGGHALFLSSRDTQLGRGEPIADSARVLSRMADIIMIRNDSQLDQEEFARHSQVPVINALSDERHPCQLLADVMTYVEHRGSIQGKTVTWLGDGNNVCHSFMAAAKQFDFQLRVASPADYQPGAEHISEAAGHYEWIADPDLACQNADLIVTDVWASMGQEGEQNERLSAFTEFQVNAQRMQLANSDALFMHCLPAHREEEVSAEVIDGPQSVVWDEAENRLHAQKALLLMLMEFSQ